MAVRTFVDVDRPVTAAEHRLPAFVELAAPILDGGVTIVVGVLSGMIYSRLSGLGVDTTMLFGVAAMQAVIFTMIMRGWGLYETRHILSLERQMRSATAAWFLAIATILSFVFLLKAGHDFSRGSIVILALCGLAAVLGHRLAWRAALSRAVGAGILRRRSASVLSLVPLPAATRQIRALRFAGIDVAQRLELPADADDRAEFLREAVNRLREEDADEVVLVGGADQVGEIADVLSHLRMLPIPVRFLPDGALSTLVKQPVKGLGGYALVDLKREPLAPMERASKRVLDIAVAATALVMAAPLLCIAMAAIKLDTPGPVLFKQNRRGFNGRTFRILKLRTMSCMEDGTGIVQARRHDPRVTRVGQWLRRTSIDELPQLWNVLRGEMSVVGPRPHAVAHDNLYDPIIENYAFRQHVKPGLTGWAQVNGHRGETPEVSMMAARVEHDIWYVNNWSFVLDLRILLLTATRLLAKTAY